MKTAWNALLEPIKPGSSGAVVMISVFWMVQALAMNFIIGALMGNNSALGALLFIGLFGAFFVLHISGPWSKLAAFFGLASLLIPTAFAAYMTSSYFNRYVPGLDEVMLASVGLFLGGVSLDAEKYLQWLHRKPTQRLKLRGVSFPDNSGTTNRSRFI